MEEHRDGPTNHLRNRSSGLDANLRLIGPGLTNARLAQTDSVGVVGACLEEGQNDRV
jgi:hypothetical protein